MFRPLLALLLLISASGWAQAPAVAGAGFSAPALPQIPTRQFGITDYGAVGDGKTLNTGAIQKAIDAASASGGGRVLIPAGKFISGPIRLASKIDLHLAKDAALTMSASFDDFPLQGKGRESFISASGAHDVALSGEGTIDGQGQAWWDAFRKVKGTSEAGPRRPQMLLIDKCERVKLEGIHTLNPPNTHCSIRESTDVTIQGLTMTAPGDSPNTDALNIRAKNVLVKDCNISTGDDNIVFLASGGGDPAKAGVENVLVTDCKLGVGHGLSIGSYTSGGLRNIHAENITFEGTTAGIRLKAGRDRGGLVENISYKHITMKNVRYPIFLSSYYGNPKEPSHPAEDKGQSLGAMTPTWKHISIEDITVTGGKNSIIVWGLPERPISDLTLRNVKISAEAGAVVINAEKVHFSGVVITAKSEPKLRLFNAQVEGMQGGKEVGDAEVKPL